MPTLAVGLLHLLDPKFSCLSAKQVDRAVCQKKNEGNKLLVHRTQRKCRQNLQLPTVRAQRFISRPDSNIHFF
jgi:hypothetical protein